MVKIEVGFPLAAMGAKPNYDIIYIGRGDLQQTGRLRAVLYAEVTIGR
tara:strand:- start:191 stop:334 length:144 start_codon:yes stop_codon:yes gene_type:complete